MTQIRSRAWSPPSGSVTPSACVHSSPGRRRCRRSSVRRTARSRSPAAGRCGDRGSRSRPARPRTRACLISKPDPARPPAGTGPSSFPTTSSVNSHPPVIAGSTSTRSPDRTAVVSPPRSPLTNTLMCRRIGPRSSRIQPSSRDDVAPAPAAARPPSRPRTRAPATARQLAQRPRTHTTAIGAILRLLMCNRRARRAIFIGRP